MIRIALSWSRWLALEASSRGLYDGALRSSCRTRLDVPRFSGRWSGAGRYRSVLTPGAARSSRPGTGRTTPIAGPERGCDGAVCARVDQESHGGPTRILDRAGVRQRGIGFLDQRGLCPVRSAARCAEDAFRHPNSFVDALTTAARSLQLRANGKRFSSPARDYRLLRHHRPYRTLTSSFLA